MESQRLERFDASHRQMSLRRQVPRALVAPARFCYETNKSNVYVMGVY